MLPVDAVDIARARQEERGSVDVYYLCIVPNDESAPAVCELTLALVERSRRAYSSERGQGPMNLSNH